MIEGIGLTRQRDVAGTLGLAVVDLVVLGQEAARAQLYPLSDNVEELAQRPLAPLAGRRGLDPALARPGARARDREL